MTKQIKPQNQPWIPPAWEPADASALQAMLRGEATPDQQRRALDWIITKACATYDMPYRPDSARDTDFSLGRMFVGQQIVKLTKININQLPKK